MPQQVQCWRYPAGQDFFGTVVGDLVHAVFELGVGKARQQRVAVSGPVLAAEMRADLVRHQAMHQSVQHRLGDALGNDRKAGHRTDIGHGRVAAVEQAQLGVFKGPHVIDHGDADAGQRRFIAGVSQTPL